MLHTTDNLRIESIRPLLSPALLIEQYPVPETQVAFINEARRQVADIIHGRDKRQLAIVGPCSIHDPLAALEYGEKLQRASRLYEQDLFIVMRVYFEKPRTTIGWKGLINDPHLDNSFDINQGLQIARSLLLELNQKGLATATEFLDTLIPQFISDLISWGAIGARTTESQVHRELASGLSMPVGFKNGTDGNIQIASDAIKSSSHPHRFLSVTKQGVGAIVETKGNPDTHIILRGSKQGPNYDLQSIMRTQTVLDKANIKQRIMVDCSHGNSAKDHTRQCIVMQDICQQIEQHQAPICGVMLESNLKAGNQALKSKRNLIYGQSITDACIDFNETLVLLEKLAQSAAKSQAKTWRKSA